MGIVKKPPPDKKLLTDRVSYDPETGIFKHRKTHGCVKRGQIAGHSTTQGYILISAGGDRFMAHRIAWWLMYDEWPQEDIDHINGVKNDNRIENLRVLSRSSNNQNTVKASKSNKTGFLGVSLHKKSGLYRATIFVNYKQTCIGYYKTPKEASEAYLAKKREIHKSFNENRE